VGVGDYDHDGAVEYAYKVADGIRMYDPVSGQDTLLWSVASEQDGRAIFWGESGDSDPLVGIISSHSSQHAEPYGTVTTAPGT